MHLLNSPTDLTKTDTTPESAQPHAALRDQAVGLTALGVAVGLMIHTAWTHRGFWLDDAHITARYGRMIAEGHGAVFNMGDRVEGYTNFGWVVWCALLQVIAGQSADITEAIRLSGLAFLAAALGGIVLLAGRQVHTASMTPGGHIGPSVIPACLWVLLLGSYGPITCYAISGMETVAVTSAVTVAVCLWIRAGAPTAGSLAFFAIAALIRFDGVVLFALGGILSTLHWWLLGRDWKQFVRIAAPPILVYTAYHGWRFWFHGEIFPNSYHAKMASGERIRDPYHQGWYYFQITGWWWSIPLLVIQFVHDAVRRLYVPALLFLMVAGFQFYLWRLPFDWMPGGRLQMPIVPVIMLLMVLAIWRISRAIAGRHWIGSVLACVAALLLASRGFLPTANEEQRVGWRDAQVALGSVKERFTAASKALAVVMEPEDLIFTDVAGAPAYFIRASILDSWGLNDRVIGREGQLLPDPAAPGGYSFWGRVHPEYVASRRPEILLVVTLALDQRIPWADVVHHVHIAHLLREVPDFLEGYRPALIKPRDREDLYVYFLQRSDLPERSIPQDHLDFYTIEYGPATHSPKTLETFASTREDGLE